MEIADYKTFEAHEGHRRVVLIHYSRDESGYSPEQICVVCEHGVAGEGDVVLMSVKPGDVRINDHEFAERTRALNCVQSLEALLWPDFDHPEEREWDSSTTTEIANCLGNFGFGCEAARRDAEAGRHDVAAGCEGPARPG